MSALLELQDVHAAYGLSRVLFGISLEVNEGECVCLLGRNGVGKTTTMRSVMGLTPPGAGHVRFKSRDITGWSPYRVARAGIGFVPEDRRIFAPGAGRSRPSSIFSLSLARCATAEAAFCREANSRC
jgi:branched-chain amino acid transport system ATP-binding protein